VQGAGFTQGPCARARSCERPFVPYCPASPLSAEGLDETTGSLSTAGISAGSTDGMAGGELLSVASETALLLATLSEEEEASLDEEFWEELAGPCRTTTV
jgi:hypothetical protein